MKQKTILLLIIIFALASCKPKPLPKPIAYFRVSFPAHEYQRYNTDSCPMVFDYSKYASISNSNDIEYHPCWINIDYSRYKAHIHLTLRKVDNNLDSLLNDSHTLIYKHAVKADAIEPKDYVNDSLKVFATLYTISGSVASQMQFHITDSVHYYVHGSIYFRVKTNIDSLAPSIEYINKDVLHFIESFEWKKMNSDACF